jgi:tetratricopeptide (TPR) repeat protein
MFRRPMRPFRRAVIRAAIHPNPGVAQAAARANNLLAQGRPNDAAQIFEQLAQQAEQRGQLKFAGNAHAQAARAFASAKNPGSALAHSRAALNQFLQLNMIQRAVTFYNHILQALRVNGLNGEADAVTREFGNRLAQFPTPSAGSPTPRQRLPAKCPHCAAPARSDEVEWIDDQSAECIYCGGVIQTEDGA